jgi:hypothetical protein
MGINMNTATKMGPTPEIGKSRGGDTAIENNSSNPSIFTIKNTVTIDTNPIIKSVFFAPGVAEFTQVVITIAEKCKAKQKNMILW